MNDKKALRNVLPIKPSITCVSDIHLANYLLGIIAILVRAVVFYRRQMNSVIFRPQPGGRLLS